MQQRIKGQEITVLCSVGGQLDQSITDVTSFNVSAKLETKTQGFLGEFNDRTDMIYTFSTFDMELHLHTQDYMRFLKRIMDKAQRFTPDILFNITGVFQFPNGETPTLLLPDVAFGEVPFNVPARNDYVKSKLQGVCSTYEVIYS